MSENNILKEVQKWTKQKELDIIAETLFELFIKPKLDQMYVARKILSLIENYEIEDK